MNLRAAVVGVGYLGRFHAQKYKAVSGVDLVAVCDGRPEQAKAVAAELGVAVVADPRELLGKVDMVTVAASTQAHSDLGRLFLEAGVPVNLEKPLAATVDQAKQLVALAEKKKTLLCTGHIERFNPAVLTVRKELRQPRVFDLIRHTPFRARGADVSVLHDLMIHDIDLLLWLSGSDIKSLSAMGTSLISGTWDSVEVFAELGNGMSARLSASRVSSRPVRSLRVLEAGRVLHADTGSLDVDLIEPVAKDAPEPLRISKLVAEKADALQAETQAFVNAVRGSAPVVTGADGLRALEVVARIEDVLNSRSAP